MRDGVRGMLPGADANVPNSVLRVICDAMGALAHLTLQYVDYLAKMLLPDTSTDIWLDRHGQIWLVNSDGSRGRKLATLATGTVNLTGDAGVVVPQNATLKTEPLSGAQITYETLEQVNLLPASPTPVLIRALDPGIVGNLTNGQVVSFDPVLNGVDRDAIVLGEITGGTDDETDDELRARVLKRIREPPMGGDQTDYESWVLSVPGVTRAWTNALEQGIGTVVTRFMMDDLRADNNGFPLQEDVDTVAAYLDTVRPVAVKDIFVVAPIPFAINLTINQLVVDNAATREAIELSLTDMLFAKAVPGGTIYSSWVEAAISDSLGVDHFELVFTTTSMPSPGHLAILGSIIYAG